MFREFFMYHVQKTLTGGAGNSFETTILDITKDADFELRRKIHQATDDRINLRIYDEGIGRYIQKGNVDLRSQSGKALSSITANGFLAYNEPDNITFKANKNIRIEASDFSGGGNTLRLALHGNKLKEGRAPFEVTPQKYTMPFIYETTSTVVGASLTNNDILLNITDDADFLCTKLTAIVTGAGLVKISDLGRTDEQGWQNTAGHIYNVFGNSQFPNILPSPRYCKRNTTLAISFQDLTAAPNTVLFQFHGKKVF